ncbi:hypothetical protein THIX_30800 [Thiomonas sp. X19]|nr:hypothetical protein THIX_30800 [Thiomonas sp. X19]
MRAVSMTSQPNHSTERTCSNGLRQPLHVGRLGAISAYRINAATGALTPVPGSPFTFGTKPDSITIVQPQ